ncbi:MAG: hypothetical protein IJ629_04570 [Clostridia bacterium]|nr:hypothetical protein [Clostridia bacterium]
MKFESVIGNENVKDYLRKNLETNNILHSYLFLGTEGIGKLKLSKEFAKFVLCLKNQEENCTCKSCLCYQGGNHPDFTVINEDGNTIKIEDVRNLTRKNY